MKKTLKIAGIILGVLLLVLIIVPLALRGKIDQIVKREAASMLNAKLDFDKLGISLIRHFPYASLDLKGLTLVGEEPFAQDTLLSADRISVVVNLMSLFGDTGYEVNRVILDRPSVYALTLEDGRVNWDIMKESGQETPADTTASEPSTFKLSVKDVRLNEGKVVFVDDSSKMSFMTDRVNLRLKGDMSAARSDLNLQMFAGRVYYYMGGVAWINDAEIEAEINLDADFEQNKYTLSKNTVRLNAITLGLDGWVALAGDAVDMDLKLDASKVQFKDILSLIPAFYTKDFKDLSAGGDLTLAATAKGRMEGAVLPAFDVTLVVKDGSFKYAALPLGVDKINIRASVENPGGSADRTRIASDFSANLGNKGNVQMSVSVADPVSNPRFDANGAVMVDLGVIKQLYPLGDSIALNGVVTLGVNQLQGTMADVEQQRYEKLKADLIFSVQDMAVKLSGLPDVKVASVIATANPKIIALQKCDVTVGRSDISANGELSNYMAYALRGEMLTGRLAVNSNMLDLNQLMGEPSASAASGEAAPAEKTSMTAPVVPKNLNLSLNTSLKKILFQKMTIENLVGQVVVSDGAVKLNKLNMNALGGTLRTSGSYSTAVNPSAPELALDLNVDKASFARTFTELDMVQKFVPIFEKTGGNYSMSLDMTARLSADMSPDLNSVSGKGLLQSSDIHVQNIAAFDQMATLLKDDRLRNIQAKDVKISFTIQNGRIATSPFDLKLGPVNVNLSGSTGLDQTIDYTAAVALPAATTGGILSKADVKIGGTFSSPKLSLDVKAAAEEAVKNALNKGIEKLTGDKSVGEAISKQADKLRAEAKSAGDKLVEAARSEGNKLVEQAKNPLAKLAAQKGADALVKGAEKQAQKLMDEAEKQIAKLQGGTAPAEGQPAQ